MDYEVVLDGVADVRIERPDANSWDYTEITAVDAKAVPSRSLVEIVLWAEPDHLAAHCAQFRVIARPST